MSDHPATTDPALLAEVRRVGDAIFSLKNVVAANTAVLQALLEAHTGGSNTLTIPMPSASTK